MIEPNKGNNIIGDNQYKKKFKKFNNIDPLLENLLLNLNRHFLHAKTLGFTHPVTKEEIEFYAKIYSEFEYSDESSYLFSIKSMGFKTYK